VNHLVSDSLRSTRDSSLNAP